MREDLLEGLEAAYPKGFLVAHIDADGAIRLTGHQLDEHPFLTVIYHQALAIAALIGGVSR